MSDDAHAVIAAVLRKHYIWDGFDGDTVVRCRCDVDNPSITNGCEDGGWTSMAEHANHIAAEIDTALGGLTRRYTWTWPAHLTGTGRPGYGYDVDTPEEAADEGPGMTVVGRWVGGWMAEEED